MMRVHQQAPPKRAPASRPSSRPAKHAPSPPAPVQTPQRSPCPCGGGCPRCRRSAADAHEREASRASWLNLAPKGGDGAYASVLPTLPPASTLGAGAPLPASLRREWEPRLATDLSAIRVYSGPAASALAEEEHATAFTYGSHIVLGERAGSPYSSAGRSVLAHEVTHAVQQAGGGAHAGLHATPGLRVQRLDVTLEDVGGVATSAYEGVVSAPGRIRRAAVETAEEVAAFGYDQLISLLEEYAPGFLAFVRAGPVEFIKERVLEGLDSLLGGLVSRVRREGLVGALRGMFGEAFGGIGTIVSDLRAGNCDSLFSAIGSVINWAETTLGPVVGELRDFLSTVSSFVGDLWARFGQPHLDFIRGVAGEFWDSLVTMANDFWSATEEVRTAFNEVWEEFKRRFDLAWDSGVGVVEWLTGKAREAWEAIKTELGPMLLPVQILVGLLLLASPLGPFVAMAASYYAISAAVTWLYDNWGDVRQFFIDARETLYNDVFPTIMSGIDALSNAIDAAGQWLVEQLNAVSEAVRSIAAALGLAPLLDAFTDFVSGLASDVQELASWAAEEFMGLVADVRNLLRQIHETVRPLYGLIAAILLFPSFPFLLPVVVAGWFWRLTPDCIKAPVIDWVIELMRAAIQALPSFSGFGEWWPHARDQIISTLDAIAVMPMEQKIAATNRVAKMMTLEDVEWIGNLVAAAIDAPNHFIGQMEEELIGMDLTQPLPFERGAPPAAAAVLSRMPGGSSDLGALSQAELGGSDIAVDSIGRLDLERELVESANLPAVGQVVFGERSGDFASLEAIRAEMAAAPPVDELGGEGPLPGAAAAPALTPEEETEARLQSLIDQPMKEGCETAEDAQQPAATPEVIPEELKFGPLTQTQRARYTLAQMGKGLRKWFDCNKAWLIPAIILVVIALIAAEILTEGAITAALPAIMEILTAIIIGVAAIRSAYYVGEYIALAAPGDIAGGARALARSFAVIAIEAVFALLFNIGLVVKALRGGLRSALREGVAAARAFGRTTVEAAQTIGRVAVRGTGAAVRNVRRVAGAILREGRLIMEGVGEGIGRGIRSLRDFARRLWQRLRFRRFAIRRFGRNVQLWGEINPWILLANGEITWVDDLATGGRFGEAATARVGDDIIEGLLVRGSQASPDYRHIADVFAQQAVSEANVIHHAIEQQVLRRFPGLFTTAQIHAASNLRTILRGAFNSEVHLSKIRVLWNAFYTELEAARAAAGLSDDAARAAFFRFRSSVDDYIRHMQDFMSTDAAVVAAAAANNQDAVRALLAAESNRFLGGGFINTAVRNALP